MYPGTFKKVHREENIGCSEGKKKPWDWAALNTTHKYTQFVKLNFHDRIKSLPVSWDRIIFFRVPGMTLFWF